MFIHDTHLPQRLKVEHYCDPEFAQREIETLFEPGWHCVGAIPEWPKVGDYRTLELYGRPLIVWRTDDGFHTFLNVCTHRFSTLTDKPSGCFHGRIKCQYHGWEYDRQGNTCKIPDAQSFRPLKKGELGLREYRTEVVGQLIFVTLNEQADDVRTFLGEAFVDIIERKFTSQHRLTQVRELDLNCNWKIATENILEAYHIECVHPKSFKMYPVAEHCEHRLFETYDHYIHDYKDEPAAVWPARMVKKLTGTEVEYAWHHLLRYPNVILGGADPFYYIQMIWPISATTCRSRWVTMHDSGPKDSWWAFLMHRLLYRIGRKISTQVQNEDAGIYPSVHRGTVVKDRPHGGGLISAREERIFAFQDYLLRAMGEPLPETSRPQTKASRSAQASEEHAAASR